MSKKILQLISGDFEDLEVWYPVYRCREEGWQVDFAAEKPGLYHGTTANTACPARWR